jgi:bifunctional enzyme CysN/CysC
MGSVAMKDDVARRQLKIVIVGHVDHGKSTLIGRLFYETDSLPNGKFEQITDQCQRRGMPFEWAFLMDALQAERDQGVTIDTTQIRLRTADRDYIIIDAPGHRQFLKNMISGAANSEAALLVIDANEGVGEQSRRHGYLLQLLGVQQVSVAINKMDLVGYSEKRFNGVRDEYVAYLSSIGIIPTHVIPISGKEGDCLTSPSANMPWYQGPNIMDSLGSFSPNPDLNDLPLRLPVQDIYKFDERRIIVGRIESGTLRVGDDILFSPSNKLAKVASFERWEGDWKDNSPQVEATAGESVGLTLTEQIFVQRGALISHSNDAPELTNLLRARIFWLGSTALEVGSRYLLKINTAEHQVEVREIEQVLNTNDLSRVKANRIEQYEVGEVLLRLRGLAAVEDFSINHVTGRFVLLDEYRIAGGGTINLSGIANQRSELAVKSENLHPFESRIDPVCRSMANGHVGAVLWFTGLPSSGKSTLALELQNKLFAQGNQTFVLDGDNIRSRLNADLGFDPQDRTENIRRVGEVSALFADAGMIVISAFVSPYEEDRDRARAAVGNRFHCIYIDADAEICEERDPHGLWKKVRQGEISNFTGVDAPYEVPAYPELVINTGEYSIDQCVDQLLDYVNSQLVEPVRSL